MERGREMKISRGCEGAREMKGKRRGVTDCNCWSPNFVLAHIVTSQSPCVSFGNFIGHMQMFFSCLCSFGNFMTCYDIVQKQQESVIEGNLNANQVVQFELRNYTCTVPHLQSVAGINKYKVFLYLFHRGKQYLHCRAKCIGGKLVRDPALMEKCRHFYNVENNQYSI